MNKVNPRGYLDRQDWLWWALTVSQNQALDQTAERILRRGVPMVRR